MDVDASGLRSLAADITRAGTKVLPEVEKVVKKGALNVKDTMRQDMRASRSFGALANSINYDIVATSNGVEAEIGPSKRSGGSGMGLDFGANIAYFGTSRGGGGTVDVENGLRQEQPKFEKAIAEVLKNVL